MHWIEAVQYGLTAFAALFGFWAAAKVKAQGHAPTPESAHLIKRFMNVCVVLLLLSGFFALYNSYFLRAGNQEREMRPILSRMDQTIGDKLNVDTDAFAPLDSHSRQILDNMIRQLCRDVIDLSRIVRSDTASRCRARLERLPSDAPS